MNEHKNETIDDLIEDNVRLQNEVKDMKAKVAANAILLDEIKKLREDLTRANRIIDAILK